MAKLAAVRGQSLVEFSLIFPAVFLTVLLMLEFFFIARTKLVLGYVADRIARTAAAPGRLNALAPLAVEMSEKVKHFSIGPSWGIPLPAHVSQEDLPQGPDYPLLVIHPLSTPLRLSTIDVSYKVFPKTWFSKWILVPTLGAHVELPVEPEVPQS